MDLTRLAAKQKRVLEMRDFIESDVKCAQVAKKFTTILSQYSNALAACWQKKTITPEDEMQMNSLERGLENLHEETRLAGGGRSPNA